MEIEFNYRSAPSRLPKESTSLLNSVTNLNFLRNLKPSKKTFLSFQNTNKVSLETINDKNVVDNLGKINFCLSQMNSTQKNVFVLKTYDNVSTNDICKRLKISENEFWKHISEARKELKEILYTN